MQLLRCPDPDCEAPAEVVDRWCQESTDGPLEHVRTRCLQRHHFTVLAERLRPSPDSVPRASRRLAAPSDPGGG